ncbi:bifunctional riboflavin kinase/FAD synthetase [Lysinibacter sp. HNR]|uniref:bifunctional riboflavin kinase/FAD synthetase n=1 Tax=Lysinibacter sp. HNR TaxID=3031408 RepID=UPI00243601FF|nr:bifunctional riboflavin kinase/FAD synthetase [Lysinibacter sp. HNR]WGD36692.1 bifunctional riboflavin kinase/FAD synthetase [Lysinibacter sp. HNR]
MRVFSSLETIPSDLPGSVVAVGKFDAIHVGHTQILRRLRSVADERGLATVVFTFSNNPLSVVAPEACPEPLLSQAQKLELLDQENIDTVVNIPFDADFAATTPDDFARDILAGKLSAKHVLVGPDFRYGQGGSGNTDTLMRAGERLGFTVELVENVVVPDEKIHTSDSLTNKKEHLRVSATMIRSALKHGEVERAAELLGKPHSVRGEVVHGAQRGRELGFPTANLSPEPEGMVPADGVYAGWVLLGTDDAAGTVERLPAAISVGVNPTFGDVAQSQVEAYVIDRTLDLYGRTITVEFVSRIRGMVAFKSLDLLIDQITNDVAETRRILGT